MSLDTTIFTVLKENWFWIGVEDSMGQKTSLENSVFLLPIDNPPESVLLDTITFENDKFKLKWSKAIMNSIKDDFENYTIEEILENNYFNLIEDSWGKTSCNEGKLQVCAKTCGLNDAFTQQYL